MEEKLSRRKEEEELSRRKEEEEDCQGGRRRRIFQRETKALRGDRRGWLGDETDI